MNRALKALMVISFLLACSAHADGASGQPTPIAPQGLTSLEAGSGKSKVRVTIATYEGGVNEAPARRIRTLTAASHVSLVQDMEIRVGDRRLFVPLSVFSDLTDLRGGILRVGAKILVLTLSGGDASESYVVTVEFDRERVRRRTLASAMEPKSPLEEARYYTVVVKDE